MKADSFIGVTTACNKYKLIPKYDYQVELSPITRPICSLGSEVAVAVVGYESGKFCGFPEVDRHKSTQFEIVINNIQIPIYFVINSRNNYQIIKWNHLDNPTSSNIRAKIDVCIFR